MKLLLGALLVIFIPAVIIVLFLGLYPVAIVEGSLVLKRTWVMSEMSTRKFIDAQVNAGAFSADSIKDAEFLSELKRSTLTFLIEDLILEQEGKLLREDFRITSVERMEDALKEGNNLREAARTVYGLTFDQLKSLVLLPQARRDVAGEILRVQGRDFDSWLREVKKEKSVKLFFVSYEWDGEKVK